MAEKICCPKCGFIRELESNVKSELIYKMQRIVRSKEFAVFLSQYNIKGSGVLENAIQVDVDDLSKEYPKEFQGVPLEWKKHIIARC